VKILGACAAMNRLRLACTIGFTLLTLAAAAQEEPVRRVLGGERLRVLHWPEHVEMGKLAMESGESALRRLEGLLAVDLDQRVDLYIVRSQAEFDELTGMRNKPWILGRAMLGGGEPGHARRVVVKPMGPQRLPGLVTHELAHVMLDVRMGDAADEIPRWLHEGIAKYAAGDFSDADRSVIARAALAGELLDLEHIEQAFKGDREQVSLAYAQSYTLVAYLSDQKPSEGVSGLLRQLQRGRDMRTALGLAYGRPVPLMEQEWLEGLRSGYLYDLLPPPAELLIGAGFVISFLLAMFVARRRSAAIRRRMLEAERLRELVQPVSGDDGPAETSDDEDWE